MQRFARVCLQQLSLVYVDVVCFNDDGNVNAVVTGVLGRSDRTVGRQSRARGNVRSKTSRHNIPIHQIKSKQIKCDFNNG